MPFYINKKCLVHGHRFRMFPNVGLPYINCDRFRCDAVTVSMRFEDEDPALFVRLHNRIPDAIRIPPERMKEVGVEEPHDT